MGHSVGKIHPTLLLPPEYIADATHLIERAERHVYFMCLIVADQDQTGGFIDALIAAARRGVKVDVAADVFTYREIAGRFIPLFRRSKRKLESSRMARELTEAGVRFAWLGKGYWFPFRGRTHIKFCIVDDVVYSFGGVNLYDKGAANVDYMFRVRDVELAKRLAREYKRLRASKLEKHDDKSYPIRFKKNRVLIDGGIVGDSIIYRHACKLAAKAERIVLISQYCPTGRLGRLIRKVPHELYFNPPSNASFLNRLVIWFGMLLSRHKTLYRKRRYLHAKCMLFYFKNGKRAAITGSHNFVWGGVKLGTREIALETKDPDVIDQLEDFCDEQVRS